jgi:hypothetical protein
MNYSLLQPPSRTRQQFGGSFYFGQGHAVTAVTTFVCEKLRFVTHGTDFKTVNKLLSTTE